MKLNHINAIETLRRLKTNKNIDINKIIVESSLNNNINNKNSRIFLYIKKLRYITFISIVVSIIFGAIIFSVIYFTKKNNIKMISFKPIKNNTDNIDGYYIPKDKLSNTIYKKCSIENCKKCFGNSYNDTCISCLNFYNPIMNEENKIIECKYNNQTKEYNNITLKESDIIDYYSEKEVEFSLKSDKDNTIYEITSESLTEMMKDNISEIKTELMPENITNSISTIKSKLITSNILDIKSELITQGEIKREPLTTHITPMEQITTEKIKINCEPGYYLPEDNINECKPCSEIGCKICQGNTNNNFCYSCFSGYILRKIDNHLSCFKIDKNCNEYNNNTLDCVKCNDDFFLIEGRCITYSISAIYYTKEDNQKIQLISLNKKYIANIILDNEIIEGLIKNIYFEIPHRGYHQVYYFIANNPTTFAGLFRYCTHLIQVNFSSSFNTTNITNLYYMFGSCNSLQSIDFSNFDTSNVKNMGGMFYNCYSLSSINLLKFDTGNVEYFYGMFENCFSLKILDLHNFYAKNAIDSSYMFYNCYSLTSIILPYFSDNTISLLRYTDYMFFNCTNLTIISFLTFNLNNVENMNSMFEGCVSLKEIFIPNNRYSKLIIIGGIQIAIPNPYIRDFNPKKIISGSNMFKGCFSLISMNFSNWDLTNIQIMNNMFQDCYSMKIIIFGNKSFNKVSDIRYMNYTFANCKSLEYIDINNLKYTDYLIHMSHMFENCSSLKEIDISSLNIKRVQDISFMFSGCNSLISVLFNNSYENNIRYMNSLFFECSSLLSINFNNFNTKIVIDMSRMFYNCSSLTYLNLNSFNTTNVKYMDEMFYGCSSLFDLYILNFVGTSLISFKGIFNNSNKLMMRYLKYDFNQILSNGEAR